MVFNTTFKYISAISWQIYWWRKPEKNHGPVTSHWQTYRYTSPWTGLELTTLVAIGIDCTGSCKSNYHTIATMTSSK